MIWSYLEAGLRGGAGRGRVAHAEISLAHQDCPVPRRISRAQRNYVANSGSVRHSTMAKDESGTPSSRALSIQIFCVGPRRSRLCCLDSMKRTSSPREAKMSQPPPPRPPRRFWIWRNSALANSDNSTTSHAFRQKARPCQFFTQAPFQPSPSNNRSSMNSAQVGWPSNWRAGLLGIERNDAGTGPAHDRSSRRIVKTSTVRFALGNATAVRGTSVARSRPVRYSCAVMLAAGCSIVMDDRLFFAA